MIVTAPGEEGQADYGTGPMVRPPETRTYRRTRLFVFTLDYSRKSVRLFLFKSSTRRWAARALEASADVEPGGVAVASVRLRTPAAKRFKKVENATAVIWKTLLVAEKTFRRLDAPELLADVWNDVICVNGVRGVNRGEKKAAA